MEGSRVKLKLPWSVVKLIAKNNNSLIKPLKKGNTVTIIVWAVKVSNVAAENICRKNILLRK
jgi:hypothetical protein